MITCLQICLEKIIPQQRKYRILDVVFEDGSDLSFWDVYHIVKSYWKNAELFSWQENVTKKIKNNNITFFIVIDL